MRASVNKCYGSPSVLEILDIPKPVPNTNEILVKVEATTVNRTDACALRAHPFFMRPATGWFRPKRTVLGLDFAGTVEETGSDVTRFASGDQIFGLTPNGYGAHAEYLCLSADAAISRIPEGKCFEEMVVCEGAWYANTYLKAFGLKSGQRILIYGASGAIGTAALQLAKLYGAEVTAVVATQHIDLATKLGADLVVDYTAEDFTKISGSYDFVFDAVGKTSYYPCRPLLKPTGVFAATDLGPWWQNIFLSMWSSLTRSGRVILPMPKNDPAFIEFLRDQIASDRYQAVIDKTYALLDIADAYRYVDTEQKAGIVVIKVAP